MKKILLQLKRIAIFHIVDSDCKLISNANDEINLKVFEYNTKCPVLPTKMNAVNGVFEFPFPSPPEIPSACLLEVTSPTIPCGYVTGHQVTNDKSQEFDQFIETEFERHGQEICPEPTSKPWKIDGEWAWKEDSKGNPIERKKVRTGTPGGGFKDEDFWRPKGETNWRTGTGPST